MTAPAGDVDRLAGDVIGGVAGEEGGDLGHVLGTTDAADRGHGAVGLETISWEEGEVTEAVLHERGIVTVRDLRGIERDQLADWFGRWGEDLHGKARGLSDSPVSNEWEPKSVGEQETFEANTLDAAFILERVRALACKVFGRLERQGFNAFRTVTITVRFANFRTLTHRAPEDGKRGGRVRGRRPVAAPVPRPTGESPADEAPADRREGGEADEVTVAARLWARHRGRGRTMHAEPRR
jgi:nucleotidyltransferase/DNA polymerase involved in DNA repair